MSATMLSINSTLEAPHPGLNIAKTQSLSNYLGIMLGARRFPRGVRLAVGNSKDSSGVLDPVNKESVVWVV